MNSTDDKVEVSIADKVRKLLGLIDKKWSRIIVTEYGHFAVVVISERKTVYAVFDNQKSYDNDQFSKQFAELEGQYKSFRIQPYAPAGFVASMMTNGKFIAFSEQSGAAIRYSKYAKRHLLGKATPNYEAIEKLLAEAGFPNVKVRH